MYGKWKTDLQEIKGLTEYKEYILKILNTRIQENMSKELDPDSFGSPAWPYLQAAQIGARKELFQLLQIIEE